MPDLFATVGKNYPFHTQLQDFKMKKCPRYSISFLLQSKDAIEGIQLSGWIRQHREGKKISFFEMNDGSSLSHIQVVLNQNLEGYENSSDFLLGASVEIIGDLVASQGKEQKWEVQAKKIRLIGKSDVKYPLQKKGHSAEFLRNIPHLRPRTNLYGAIFRVRSRISYAIHQFFQSREFFQIHTPIITTNDCEGAGELFSLSVEENSVKKNTEELSSFFGKQAYLTVSGQLEAEAFATALSKVYTFGPTFRAENSHTKRHASEFWMIEPEIAFTSLTDIMSLAEELLLFLIDQMLEEQEGDFVIFQKFVDTQLEEKLKKMREKGFQRIPYSEAFQILSSSGKKFKYPIEPEMNFQTEHERFLVEEYFQAPLVIFDYPKKIKPFYMRRNEDGKSVSGMDILLPGIGEIIGGSQREERLPYLKKAMQEAGISVEEYQWYLDLRRYGSVPHSGFGLGFERILMFLTGVENIRDVLPYPRVPGNFNP